LAFVRTAPKRVPRLTTGRQTIRTFADVVPAPPSQQTPPAPSLKKGRIPVREDHGLYAFFRRKEGDDLTGDANYEVVETPEKNQHLTGRGWRASELRLKSFQDLHTLWYVLLRERNLLATQREEARRMGVDNSDSQVSLEKVHHCRKSMARIKAVINERRLAYEGAVKIAEQQVEDHQDRMVLRHQAKEFNTERKYLQRRREYMARKLEAKRSNEDAEEKAAQGQVNEATAGGVSEARSIGERIESQAEEVPEVPPAIVKGTEGGLVEEEGETPPGKLHPKPIDTAIAGLDVQTSKTREHP